MIKVFPQTISFEVFEKAVMEMLLQDNHPILTVLHQQYLASTVLNRDLSGVGFFTTFNVPNDITCVGKQSFAFGDVVAEIEGLKHGAGFVLFVEHGVIHTLEGYTYGESWPIQITGVRLSHIKENRDFSSFPKI